MKYPELAIKYSNIYLAATILLSLLLNHGPVLAQEQEGLSLNLQRNFGYSSGTGRIQGNFTASASGPDNLTSVVFLIDGQEMGTATQAPFKLTFDTDSYPLGVHTLSAKGFTADGQEVQSLEQRREFVPAEEGWKTAGKVAIPIVSVVFLMMLLSFVLPMVMGRGKRSNLPLGASRNYGMLGGAICPKCGRPFGMHIWGLNLVAGKLDRCPHCGKWSLVNRTSMDALHAAEHAEMEGTQPKSLAPTTASEEEIRKELDDSRYQDL